MQAREVQARVLAAVVVDHWDEEAVFATIGAQQDLQSEGVLGELPAPIAAALAAGNGTGAADFCRRPAVGYSWLLSLSSEPLQHAVLQRVLEVWPAHRRRLSNDALVVLMVLAAQLDSAADLARLAAAVPPGRPEAELRMLASNLVPAALRSAGGRGSTGAALACLVQLAAGAAPLPTPLAPSLGAELAGRLASAAKDGYVLLLAALLEAGVPVTPAAVRAAVRGGSATALATLLRYGAPPTERLPAGTVVVIPSGDGVPAVYTCPLLTLLAAHAEQGHEALHTESLRMAELLVAAGYRPAGYRNVAVRRRGGQGAHRIPLLDPALHDRGLAVRGAGRYVWLAAIDAPWRPAAHHAFPPAFRAAAAALLLASARASRRHGAGAGGGLWGRCAAAAAEPAEGLGRLPIAVLEEIIRLAARPLSAWAQAPWEAAADWVAAALPAPQEPVPALHEQVGESS